MFFFLCRFIYLFIKFFLEKNLNGKKAAYRKQKALLS